MSNWFYWDYQFTGREMPVPIWDCPDLCLLNEPVDTTTVVSEDIWKKFDLDFPQPLSVDVHCGPIDEGTTNDPYDRPGPYSMSCCYRSCYCTLDPGEIRQHDCMWAGLCVSKDHNRPLAALQDVQIQSMVPAGRSLLINRAKAPQMNLQQQRAPVAMVKNLESDGDSTRPETPQSCESESEESEDEVPTFRHDSISINDKLSEYIGTGNSTPHSVPASEVTGQLVVYRGGFDMKNFNSSGGSNVKQDVGYRNNNKTSDTTTVESNNNATCNNIVPLADHCYHLNQPTTNSKKLEHLGVQTPSDSEEEIDVVTFDKPSRPASLPTNPSLADKQHLQKTVTSALKDKSPPRPRGRPPSNVSRKRSAPTESRPAKRPKLKSSYQKRGVKLSNLVTVQNAKNYIERNERLITENSRTTESTLNQVESTQSFASKNETSDDVLSSPCKGNKSSSSASRSTSSDDEPDTEKRSLHNNMERQRRIELRNSFEELRLLVPEVETKEKAPKVVILRQAAAYCDKLTEIGLATTAKVSKLKREQDQLRSRLSQLRRNFRSERRVAAAHK